MTRVQILAEARTPTGLIIQTVRYYPTAIGRDRAALYFRTLSHEVTFVTRRQHARPYGMIATHKHRDTLLTEIRRRNTEAL